MTPIKQNMLATRNLKYIYMGSNQLSPKSLGMLAEGIVVNSAIEELTFTHNSLCIENGKTFIQSLKSLVNLRKLSLNSCQLQTHGPELLQELKESLIDTDELIALNLYSNDINAEGAALLSQLLVNKTKLKTLGLSNNLIGHGGARELANVCLKNLTSLQQLSLESNLISNIGLSNISTALMHNQSL